MPNSVSQVPFVDLKAQYQTICDEVDQAILEVVRGAGFILGKQVGAFEEEFASFCGTRYAVGVDSGTSALELALRAFGIGPGDEVITAANTFIATALAISFTGATPVLVDQDPGTYNLDVSRLESALTHRTRAILPVHLYGQPADMDPIMEVAGRHGLVVIEDACQAHGARYKGRRAGSIGHAAAFSFYSSKNLGAYGDGGMVVSNDERIRDSVRMLRDFGQREKYRHELKGYNRRLDTLQAAVLRIKLKYLDEWNQSRREIADWYGKLLGPAGIAVPDRAGYAEHVYHLYVIRVADRNGLAAYLKQNGIATGIHYPIPIHLQPAYRDLGHQKGDFPITEDFADQIISLPMYAELPRESVEFVSHAILESGQVASETSPAVSKGLV